MCDNDDEEEEEGSCRLFLSFVLSIDLSVLFYLILSQVFAIVDHELQRLPVSPEAVAIESFLLVSSAGFGVPKPSKGSVSFFLLFFFFVLSLSLSLPFFTRSRKKKRKN